MIKLIVCDMDGTLLNDDKQLPENFWQIEEALYNKNIRLAIASGRQHFNLADVFERIKERCYILAENGAITMLNNECLYTNPIEKKDMSLLIETGRNIKNADIIYSGAKSAYVENDDKKLWKHASKYHKKLELVESLNNVNDDCLKFTIYDQSGSQQNSYEHFKQFKHKFKIAVSGKHWLDVNNIETNKGSAVKVLQNKLQISYDETMVFGDYLNDLEMMSVGKYSYAMKNARPEIVAAANFQTEYSNNENGVVRTIKKIISL